MKAEIKVTVEKGSVDVMLYEEGCPVEGHGDSTNTLPVWQLLAPLADRVQAKAEAARL